MHDGEEPDQAELLTDQGHDHVAVGKRHQVRPALAEARADEAAVGHAEEALRRSVRCRPGNGRRPPG